MKNYDSLTQTTERVATCPMCSYKHPGLSRLCGEVEKEREIAVEALAQLQRELYKTREDVERLAQNIRQDAWLCLAYHQLLKEAGISPSSRDLLEAYERTKRER